MGSIISHRIDCNGVGVLSGKRQQQQLRAWNRLGWNPRTTSIVNHKLISFAALIALRTQVTLPLETIRILLMWKYIQDKKYAILARFGRYIAKAKLFCLKSFNRLPGLGLFRMKSFHLGYRDLGHNPGTRPLKWTHQEWRGEQANPARKRSVVDTCKSICPLRYSFSNFIVRVLILRQHSFQLRPRMAVVGDTKMYLSW